MSSCAVCNKGPNGLLRCGRCKSTYYCSKEHQQEHWASHKGSCSAPPSNPPSALVRAWGAPKDVPRIDLLSLTPPAFAQRFQNPTLPCVLTGCIPVEVLRDFASASRVGQLMQQQPLQVRMYGANHVKHTERWPELGYVPNVEYVSGTVFSEWILNGTAARDDRYVASCDIRETVCSFSLHFSSSILSLSLTYPLNSKGGRETALASL